MCVRSTKQLLEGVFALTRQDEISGEFAFLRRRLIHSVDTMPFIARKGGIIKLGEDRQGSPSWPAPPHPQGWLVRRSSYCNTGSMASLDVPLVNLQYSRLIMAPMVTDLLVTSLILGTELNRLDADNLGLSVTREGCAVT